MNYGVVPEGFSRKPLPVILAEIEAALITEFGPDVVQTSQSPLGQINGLMADFISEVWEIGEDIYQSYDPTQAEGTRLDALARLRLLLRSADETDDQFRQAVTNQGTARISLADLARAVQGIDGVTFAQVFVNDTASIDANRMPRNTIAVVVLGGDDADIAEAMNQYVPPGISTHGNTSISVNDEGYCRTLRVIRPIEVPIDLRVQIKTGTDRRGCPPAAQASIAQALLAYLTAPRTRPWNGEDLSPYMLRSFIESNFPAVEFVNLIGTKEGEEETPYYSLVPIDFFEIAKVTQVQVEVV